jgi:hypothetical protein
MTTPTKDDIIRQAEAAHLAYPQYRGHWRGSEWKLVLLRRDIRTKMGLAFERGDVTISRPAQDHPGYVDAYSTRNNVDTRIGARDAAEMVDLQKFVAIRYRLERLAVQVGARQLKSAACLLVLDDGDGQEARRALGELRSCPFEHGEVKSIIHEIEQLLEAA